jgi:hypothetical protein
MTKKRFILGGLPMVAIGLALLACGLGVVSFLRRSETPDAPSTASARESVSPAPSREVAAPKLREAEQLAATSPQQALELANQLPPSSARNALLEKITRTWVASDPADTVEWIQALDANAPNRSLLLICALKEWSKNAPEPAISLAIEELPESAQRTTLVLEMIEDWAQTSFADAEVWVSNFDEGPLKEAAVAKLAELEPAASTHRTEGKKEQ